MRILTWALLGTALLAACGGRDPSPVATPTTTAPAPATPSVATPAPIKTEDVTTTPAPATASPAATPPPATPDAGHDTGPDYPVYEPATRTGIPAADRLIAAVVDGDLDAAAASAQYLRLPCVGMEKSGASGVIRCQASEADGTIVSVFPVVFSERTYLRPDDAAPALRQLVRPGARVFAVYRVPATEQGNPDWPGGNTGIVFVAGGRGILARVNDNGIVLLNLGADAIRDPYELTNLYHDFVLPPRR